MVQILKKQKFIAILSFIMIIGTACCPLLASAKDIIGDELLEINRNIKVESNEVANWPEGPIVGAESAVLMDADTGAILYEKNMHAREYPASTTKILTCLIAAENCDNDEMVTFSHNAVFDTPRNSNNIAIDQGESLTVLECLQAILIRSANECAFAIAEHIVHDDWKEFAKLMNERAAELGCIESNFVNPNGLPDDNHYTSAYDLAMIGRAFFDNDFLCNISMMTRLHIYPSSNQPDEIIENTTNKLLSGKEYEYKYLIGSKTGYTDEARSCLVSCAQKDGLKLICVVMRDEAPNQFLDTISLFDYGFSNFEKVNVSQTETKYDISTNGSFYSGIDVLGNSNPILALNKEDCIIVPKTVDFSGLESTISYETEIPSEAAVITYSYHGRFLGEATVDFSMEKNEGYSFESATDSLITEEKEDIIEEDDPVVFVNVVKIAIVAGIVLAGGFILFLIIRGIVNYRRRHPNWRANWKRDRRKKKRRSKYIDIHEEAKAHRAVFKAEGRRRNRGRKRISRRLNRRK